jgi:NAD/NADP transhydrogenase beta subunit
MATMAMVAMVAMALVVGLVGITAIGGCEGPTVLSSSKIAAILLASMAFLLCRRSNTIELLGLTIPTQLKLTLGS